MKKMPSALRNVRRARTLSQMDLARLAGIKQPTLSKYEQGLLVPPVDVQARLAAILGVAVADVFPQSESVAS